MKCPKCGADQASETICEHCGIVFEKYYNYHPRPGGDPLPVVHLRRTARNDQGFAALLLPGEQKGDWLALVARTVLLVILSLWGMRLALSSVASNTAGESFLHLVNLPFHEFGHILFRPFGAFLASLGGTLGQLLMPLICTCVLLLTTRDPFGASVALWWFGENFLDIAPYINDAQAGQLPLLGGNFGHSSPYGFHDWEYILNESGFLHLDHTLARASHLLGTLIMLAALIWGAILLYRHYRQLQ